MNIQLILLSTETLEFARKLRNKNRYYFCNSQYITKAKHQEWFKNLDYSFFIILCSTVPVGTISLKAIGDTYEIGNVIIEETRRGEGILSETFKQILKLTNQSKSISLHVLKENQQAIKAYEKLGFKKHKIIDRNQVQYVYKPSYSNHSNI